MSGILRRLADWLDDHLGHSAGRIHSSQLDGLQHRDRDLLYLAVGPVAVMVDIPERWSRPAPEKPKPVDLDSRYFSGGTA